jgi:tRNA threonylcarbamoyladenosine biosynthesis protein TsaB
VTVVLALETSTAQSSVCLAGDEGLLAGATLGAPKGRAHGEFLMPAVAFCLSQVGLEVGDLTGVAVGLGPGLFTGMRVGIASAQALAHARGLPVVGVASLDLLAFPARHSRRLLCAAVDAKRGELFWAFYRPAPGGIQRLTEYRVGPVGKLAGEIQAVGDDVLCVGDGAVAQRAALEATGAEVATHATAYPTAQSLAELAMHRLRRGDGGRATDLEPIYLRRPDAKIGWPARAAMRGGSAQAAAREGEG